MHPRREARWNPGRQAYLMDEDFRPKCHQG
jgi:hypothetical protein